MKLSINISILSIVILGAFILFASSFQPVSAAVTATTGGNGPIPASVNIYNENLYYTSPTTAVLTWDTDKPATSRVVYGDKSQKVMFSNLRHANYGYEKSTRQDDTLKTKHSVIISGLNSEMQYFFRPESRIRNYANSGNEKTSAERSIINRNASADCTYINTYLRMGDNNDPAEVTKLQLFLRDKEGFSNLAISGSFDQATLDAVSQFQMKYKEDILAPWGIDFSTGYVYYTTQNKINELQCNKTVSLSGAQMLEIEQFKILFEEAQKNDQILNIDFETIGQSENDNDFQEDSNGSLQASVIQSEKNIVRKGFFSRLLDFLRRR